MENQRRELIRRFQARDGEGREYTIHVYASLLDAGGFSDPDVEILGEKSYQTSDGAPVIRTGKGRYDIVGPPTIPLTSDDPI